MALRIGPNQVGSRMAGPLSADFDPPALATASGSAGPYLSSLTRDGKTWTFVEAPLFTARIYSVTFDIEADVDASNFTLALVATVDGVTTYTWTGNAPRSGLTIKLRVRNSPAGLIYDAPEVFACPDELSVMLVRFPYQKTEAYDDDADSWGVIGSSVVPLPHTLADVAGALQTIPPALQYGGLYDSASKACLMWWVDDDAGHCTRVKLTGQTTSTLFYVEHNMDRRYTGGSLSAKTYKVHLETFTGLAARGELCFEDFNDRFRAWATAPARTSMTRGRWYDSDDVSGLIKAIGLVYNGPASVDAGWTRCRVALTRLAAYLGDPSAILCRGLFSLFATPPDALQGQPLSITYTDELDAIQALGVPVQVYTMVLFWDPAITGTFDPDNYSSYGDLKTRMLRTIANVAKVTAGAFYTWDFTETDVPAIIASLVASYFAAHSSGKPDGTYLDSMGLLNDSAGGGIGVAQDDNPADTDWTFAAQQAGNAAVIEAVRDARRVADPDAIVGTECLDPLSLPVIDLFGVGRPGVGSDSGFGLDTRAGEYVYGEYVRFCRLDGLGLFGTDVIPGFGATQASFMFGTIQGITHDWRLSGIVSVCDRSASSELVASDVEGGNFYGPMWEWIKKLVTLAMGEGADYFRGRRMRGLGDDFDVAIFGAIGIYEVNLLTRAWPYPIQTSVWQKSDGSLGIFVAHTYRSGMTSPYGSPTAGARTVTIALDHRAYGLTSSPKVLVRNDDGERVLLKKWTTSVSVDVEVDEFTVTLFEVLEDDGSF